MGTEQTARLPFVWRRWERRKVVSSEVVVFAPTPCQVLRDEDTWPKGGTILDGLSHAPGPADQQDKARIP